MIEKLLLPISLCVLLLSGTFALIKFQNDVKSNREIENTMWREKIRGGGRYEKYRTNGISPSTPSERLYITQGDNPAGKKSLTMTDQDGNVEVIEYEGRLGAGPGPIEEKSPEVFALNGIEYEIEMIAQDAR